MEPSRRDLTDVLRSAGSLLIAVGAVALLLRKSNFAGWTDFERMLAIAVPAGLLYGIAAGPGLRLGAPAPAPWRSVAMVTSLLLWPLALFLLERWAGASTHHVLYVAAVFAAVTALAAAGARRTGARYALFVAGLAALVTWLLLWDKILDHPSAGTFRWLLVVAAALLLAGALLASLAGSRGAGDLATAGGLTAVLAGVFGVVVAEIQILTLPFLRLTKPSDEGVATREITAHHASGHVAVLHPLHPHSPLHVFGQYHLSGTQHFGWDVYLLVVSLLAVTLGARARIRGLGYAGALGLFVFAVSVSAQLSRLVHGKGPTHSLAGWPLVLLVLGLLALAASLPLARRAQGARRPPAA